MYAWFRALRIDELDFGDIILWNIFSDEMCTKLSCYYMLRYWPDTFLAAIVFDLVYFVNDNYSSLVGRRDV